jgi:beta-phosphoglucomutase-like phosphatase (HAD superfamily)
MDARSRKNIAALRAAAEIAAVDMDKCILLAGAQTGPLAASRIGMPCVVVRSRLVASAFIFSITTLTIVMLLLLRFVML